MLAVPQLEVECFIWAVRKIAANVGEIITAVAVLISPPQARDQAGCADIGIDKSRVTYPAPNSGKGKGKIVVDVELGMCAAKCFRYKFRLQKIVATLEVDERKYLHIILIALVGPFVEGFAEEKIADRVVQKANGCIREIFQRGAKIGLKAGVKAEIRIFDVPLINALLHILVNEYILRLRVVLRLHSTAKQVCQRSKEIGMDEACQGIRQMAFVFFERL